MVAVRLHICHCWPSLKISSKSVPNFLTYVEHRQTDRHTIDKRDATKNTRAKTFNNQIHTVGLLYSCLQVGHGHCCLIWLLSFSLSQSLLLCQFTMTLSKYWGIIPHLIIWGDDPPYPLKFPPTYIFDSRLIPIMHSYFAVYNHHSAAI